jgi:hypothetical protein
MHISGIEFRFAAHLLNVDYCTYDSDTPSEKKEHGQERVGLKKHEPGGGQADNHSDRAYLRASPPVAYDF